MASNSPPSIDEVEAGPNVDSGDAGSNSDPAQKVKFEPTLQ